MRTTLFLFGLAVAPLVVGCASSGYDPTPRRPAVMWPPGQGTPGPGAPRVHLQLDPPDSTLPEVELREVAGLEEQTYGASGPMGGSSGVRLVPGSITVCPIPCGAILDGTPHREFFFGGEGIRASKHFHLENETGELTIKVKPSSGVQWKAGEGLTIAGSPLLFFGTILLANWLGSKGVGSKPVPAPIIVFTGASAALVVSGIAMMLTGGTTYSIQRSAPPRTAP
ncbi:MAG: hypothetical protein ABJE95_02160 [Byssovorax sp.]